MITLVFRGLAERRLRSILTGLAIVLGVAMIAGTYVQTDQIKAAFNDITKTTMSGTAVMISPKQAFESDMTPSIPPFSASVIEQVVRVPGVQRAEGSLYEAGSLVVHGKRVGSRYAPGIVVSDSKAPFDPARYIRGGKPQPGEVSVNAKLASDERLRVGQQVQIATRSGIQRARLSGIFNFGDVSSLGGATLIVAPLDDVQRWYDAVGQVSGISVAAQPGMDASFLARRIKSVLPADRFTVRTGQQEATHAADQVNKQLGRFLTPMLMSLAGAALLVGAFIIFNTFSITVAQRVREIALLRAIGATRRQVVASVTGEALVIGAVASVVGLFAGIGIAKGMGALFDAAGFGIPRSGIVMEPRTVVISLLVGVIVTVLAALLPAVRATRVAPVAAMTGAPAESARARRWAPWVAGAVSLAGLATLLMGLFSNGSATQRITGMAGGAVLLFIGVALSARWFVRPVAAAVGLPVERLFKVPGRIARENAMRNPSRTAATSAALMVGLGLVVFVAVFAAGLKASMNQSMDDVMKADFVVKAQSFEPLPAGAGKKVAATPGVQTSTAIYFDRVEVDRANVKSSTDTLEGIDPRALGAVYKFKWVEGSDRLLQRMSSVDALMEKQFARAHGLKVGDVITLQTPSGVSSYVRAIGEYDDPMLLSGIMVTDAAFRSMSGARDPFFYLIKQVPGMPTATVKASLNRTMLNFPTAEAKSNAEYRQQFEDQVQTMVNMLYALLAMCVVISLFGIANSLFLSIHERTREFGLLRAVGATRAQVRRVVRYESVITAVLGGLLGIVIGLLFGWLITRALADLGFAFAVPGVQLVVFFVLAVVVGVVGAIAPARRSARIDVLEALHYE